MTGYTLRDYQVVARDFLRDRGRASLFLDMGLGKSACALTALEPRHLPALVIAPKRVAEVVWPAEHRLWRPELNLRVAKGDPAARRSVLQDETADVVVLGVENIKDTLELRPGRFRTVIFDELSKFKGRGVWWKTAKRLTRDPDVYVWGLTGTPMPNGYLDLWPQVFLLDNGAHLGKTITGYKERYFYVKKQLPTGIVTEWGMLPGAESKINSLLEDFCLSMGTEGRIHLPDVTYNTVTIELPAKVKTVYRRITNDLLVDLHDLFGGEIHTAMSPGALTSKLSQIVAGFIYADAAPGETDHGGRYTWLHDEKIRAVQEIIEGTGSPVLVFYRFIPEKERLLATLPGARTIDSPGVIDAWNRGEVPVLVAHPASAGHGLNLQHGGHTIVWTSPTWDAEHWEQGNKRLHRSGQTHPVVIHTVMADRSVDHLIRAVVTGKVTTQDALLAHLESPI